jgi:DNA-directed RNA polymerase subunit RPC12/RpoP
MTREVYKLTCYRCARTVELPAGKPEQTERFACPHCGAALCLDWRPAE